MREGIPALSAFHEKHAERRDRFEILAIHDGTAKTLDELDARLGGKTLPFPVLLDAEGKTVEAFGVSEFPTVLLVDPAGKIVSVGNEGTLKEQLGLLEQKLSK